MRHFRRKTTSTLCYLLCAVMAFLLAGTVPAVPVQAAAKATNAKIHFINISGNNDAILLECNGAFGMVDSGEDNLYPDGSNPRYPWRSGIIKGAGQETKVVNYVKKIMDAAGAKRLEFYIGTHPHSDHIGSAWKIIQTFQPKRVYLKKYKDSYVSNKTRLWDNLFVYENTVKAVESVNKKASNAEDGITLIQNLNPSAKYVDPLRKDTTGASKPTPTPTPTVTPTATPEPTSTPEPSPTETPQPAQSAPGLISSEETPDPAADGDPQAEPDTSGSETPVGSSEEDSPDTSAATTPADPEEDAPDGSGSDIWSDVTAEDTQQLAEVSENANETDPEKAPGSEPAFQGELTDLDSMSQEELEKYFTEAAPVEAETVTDIADGDLAEDIDGGELPAGEIIEDYTPFVENRAADPQALSLPNSSPQTAKPVFTLGDGMRIEIMNYEKNPEKKPYPDANYFCYGVKVTANGRTAFLSGDINNYDGDETRLAAKLGRVDVLKLGHHGYYGSNSTAYLKKLSPKIAVLTGVTSQTQEDMWKTLLALKTRTYVTTAYASSTPATIISMGTSSASINIYTSPTMSKLVNLVHIGSSDRYMLLCNGLQYTGKGFTKAGGQYYYIPSSKASPYRNKWLKYKGEYYYFKSNCAMAKGWEKVDSKWYYMDSTGIMQTGWLTDAGSKYYLSSSGAMLTGSQKIGNYWYYFDGSGAMKKNCWIGDNFYNASGRWVPGQPLTGWQKDSKGYWWRNEDGTKVKSSWQKAGSYWYYLDKNGYRFTGFNTIKGQKYYFDTSGRMLTGLQKVNGKLRFFRLSGSLQGAMVTGWYNNSAGRYYFDPSTGERTTGWKTINKRKYYFASNGLMQTGVQTISKKTYYFAPKGAGALKGAMVTGWYNNIKGRYYFNPTTGERSTGWQTISKRKYYFSPYGVMQTGAKTIDGLTYYFAPSGSGALKGAMVTGWYNNSVGKYYFDPATGARSTGWTPIDGKTYYFYGNGRLLRSTGWQTIDGVKHYIDGNYSAAIPADGWFRTEDGTYYLDPEQFGAMVTGWLDKDHVTYYMDPQTGKMSIGFAQIEGLWYYFNGDGSKNTSGWLSLSEDGQNQMYYLDPETGARAQGKFMTLKDYEHLDEPYAPSYTYYFLEETGKMATDADGTVLTRDENGTYWLCTFDEKGKIQTKTYTQAPPEPTAAPEGEVSPDLTQPAAGTITGAESGSDTGPNTGFDTGSDTGPEMGDKPGNAPSSPVISAE